MPSDSVVHLHLHTEYSLLDGAIRTKELMRKARASSRRNTEIVKHVAPQDRAFAAAERHLPNAADWPLQSVRRSAAEAHQR